MQKNREKSIKSHARGSHEPARKKKRNQKAVKIFFSTLLCFFLGSNQSKFTIYLFKFSSLSCAAHLIRFSLPLSFCRHISTMPNQICCEIAAPQMRESKVKTMFDIDVTWWTFFYVDQRALLLMMMISPRWKHNIIFIFFETKACLSVLKNVLIPSKMTHKAALLLCSRI